MTDDLILVLYTAPVKDRRSQREAAGPWQKTQYSNLIRYVPSGTFFARFRIRGKLVRKTLKTDVLTVALEAGALDPNPAQGIKRAKVPPHQLTLECASRPDDPGHAPTVLVVGWVTRTGARWR